MQSLVIHSSRNLPSHFGVGRIQVARAVSVVKPHHAGDAYINLAITVAWKTFWMQSLSIPCALNIFRAYSALAEPDNTDAMWSSIVKLSAKTTPRSLMRLTRGTPGISGITGIFALRVYGLKNTISCDFFLFNCKLFRTAQTSMFCNSIVLLSTLEAGTIRSCKAGRFNPTWTNL